MTHFDLHNVQHMSHIPRNDCIPCKIFHAYTKLGVFKAIVYQGTTVLSLWATLIINIKLAPIKIHI